MAVTEVERLAGSVAIRALPAGTNPAATGLSIGEFHPEAGGLIPDAVLAVQTWGSLTTARDNAVLVEHALTGDSHVTGTSGPGQPTAGWWDALIGPGRVIDTDRFFVVAINAIGGCRGSTGPSSLATDGRAWGSRFPELTIRDQVVAEASVADLLGIDRWHLVVGGSMGGMRALEWAAGYPERVHQVAVIASCAAATSDQIGWGHMQSVAITNDPDYRSGDYYDTGRAPRNGLALARRIAHSTYRSAPEYEHRFARRPQPGEDPLRGGRFAVEGYLDHHGAKLTGRFDAGSYLSFTRAMATHDIGRDRGGAAQALQGFHGELIVAAVDSDRLWPPHCSQQIVDAAGRGTVQLIRSEHGHDGFLLESDQVADILTPACQRTDQPAAAARESSSSRSSNTSSSNGQSSNGQSSKGNSASGHTANSHSLNSTAASMVRSADVG